MLGRPNTLGGKSELTDDVREKIEELSAEHSNIRSFVYELYLDPEDNLEVKELWAVFDDRAMLHFKGNRMGDWATSSADYVAEGSPAKPKSFKLADEDDED